MPNSYTWVAIAVIVLVTALIRFLPFVIFNGNSVGQSFFFFTK